eukprot:NODE_7231_length_1598_cov_3.597553.p1 GENE.NODE_7231_length_1598_cov_3.597553~~NODE_7231_length_1598_cov_3.597553.p1  ORF type:complete len:506 (-),score=211.36 NODE_7231_length_1598_cov_3.597553:79-1557(-)
MTGSGAPGEEDPSAATAAAEDAVHDESEDERAELEALRAQATPEAWLKHDAKLLRKIKQLQQQKQELKFKLARYKVKEKELVVHMDSHMDEVERTEHTLNKCIETLTAENQQLRFFTERRARDNAELIEKLRDATRSCGESETRVQFLMDRIMTLLSAGAADPVRVDAVVTMREREREMLRQLEETRQQFDDVWRQNGELTSRITEELGLTRTLSDQLAEVEGRLYLQLPAASGVADGTSALHPRPRCMPRTSPQPASELSPDRVPRRISPPWRVASVGSEVESVRGTAPPPVDEAEHPRLGDLNAIPEADGLQNSESMFMDEQHEPMLDGAEGREPSSSPPPPPPPPPAPALAAAPPWPRPQEQRSGGSGATTTPAKPPMSAQRVLLLEERLCQALDAANFQCEVSRVDPSGGVYSFGSLHASVELTADNALIAAGADGRFMPINAFIRRDRERGNDQEKALPPPSGGEALVSPRDALIADGCGAPGNPRP